jgi:hypothetical protein
MPQDSNAILDKMLERLFAAMANGPSLNCKPHSSRQRVDLAQFARLQDVEPKDILQNLLSGARAAKIVAKVPPPKRRGGKKFEEPLAEDDDDKLSPEDRAALKAWAEQQSLMGKLRTIAEDAKTYENDTGVHVLHLGFPLLSLPPGTFGLQRSFTRRILAPLAFISVSITLRGGSSPSVSLDCRNEGAELVVPNTALLAWLEQQTGKEAAEISEDETGDKPWHEIASIVDRVANLMSVPVPEFFRNLLTAPADQELDLFGLSLQSAPRHEEEDAKAQIIPASILGLFPMTNQGLLRDTQAMAAGESLGGPVQSFLKIDASLMASTSELTPDVVMKRRRVFAEERFVSGADPCQARAVKLSRTSRGLVIHGPPGTGKSQTITNVIGDHLARGERVLFVCDKRTALDVVMNRLEGLGLGQLCAVVHDPQRDQRELYKSIREQLDALPELATNAKADGQLAKVDEELQRLHDELGRAHDALMESPSPDGMSFHELMGRWLKLPTYANQMKDEAVLGITPAELDRDSQVIGDLFQRAVSASYPTNPWVQAAGLALPEFLSAPMDQYRQAMVRIADAATAADATLDFAIPPFAPSIDLALQGKKRAELVEPLEQLIRLADPAILARWANARLESIRAEREKLSDLAPLIEILNAAALDTELAIAARTEPLRLAAIGQKMTALDQYLAISTKWYRIFAFGKKSAAAKALSAHSLPFSVENVQRLRRFLTGLRARLVLQSLHADLLGQAPSAGLISDEVLKKSLSNHVLLFDTLIRVSQEQELAGLQAVIAGALTNRESAATVLDGLRGSPARAAALAALENALAQSRMLRADWATAKGVAIRKGSSAQELLSPIVDKLEALETVLRVQAGLAALPTPLRLATGQLIQQGVQSEQGLVVLMKAALALQITERLKADPSLQAIDRQRLKSTFDRYRSLDLQKKSLVKDSILHRWTTKQQERLLAATGSRLNGQGADLRRRLTIRGERAMRLRQVIAVGKAIEGGDPLFDLRPVWMASPETVAQVLPREAVFDVVIFDEASQCRLEEALPVLTRAHRFVVAGDPRQLPPTRFFETALAASGDDEIETDQQLFESQQGEIEDLLAAALNIEIQECYLDVHYRSRNSDLIEFSNQHFYDARLQAIPSHPSNRTRFSPLTLYKAGGTYEKRRNQAEADQVCKIVQDLLKRADPPSIGIACFNLSQRDLIVETLEEAAMDDPAFGKKLAEARTRRGAASFEGLFVKNLENVQGDERDHIIISTTYGPDTQGRFYRRFGPVGRAGGGRRLNVLVTRAREEVHLVTSIPDSEYRALPPIPAGETPGGAWLLFSYLAYAEKLAEEYEANHRVLSEAGEEDQPATVNVRPSKSPSVFSESFGRRLVHEQKIGSDVHWGNDGFCVDLALHHPRRAEDVTIGVLCDLTRFRGAQDAVEWEIFRTGILENQGWMLHRLWTPNFFRDGKGAVAAVLSDVEASLADDPEKDAINV